MHIQKNWTEKPHVSDSPPAQTRSVKGVHAKLPAQTKPDVPAARSVSSLIASSGLPSDKLSASILSFARFFSLPLKPQVLADIRRQAWMQTAASLQETAQQAEAHKAASAEASRSGLQKQTIADNASLKDGSSAEKNRAALSLAAAAAESKGIGLDDKGLESFAKALDPQWERRQDSGGQNRRQHSQNQNEQNDEKENSILKTGSVRRASDCSSFALEKAVLESAENDPLLDILNKLPGKNGQRWIVLPFDFCENDHDFRVSMRILMEAELPGIFMTLDITETGKTGKNWLFILESANSKVSRLSVFVQDELSSRESSLIQHELSSLFEIPFEHIFVRQRHESFPFEASRGEDLLQSIDEAV